MKKNWTVKVAAFMLALTMISACFVGSTFAKYVTRAQGSDWARVAKWGVLVSVEGGGFGWRYAAEDQDYLNAGGEYSVINAWGTDGFVVAPGTSSANLGENIVARIAGAPEVAARYAIKGEDVMDILLPAGTYTDYTQLMEEWVENPPNSGNWERTYGYTDTFTLATDYSPIKWNLVISKGSQSINVVDEIYAALQAQAPNLIPVVESYGFTRNGCSFFNAIAILERVASSQQYTQIVEEALGNMVSGGRNFMLSATPAHIENNTLVGGEFELSYDFDPNKDMDFTFELTWEWAFEQTNPNLTDPIQAALYTERYNKADTFLGNLAAVRYFQQDIPGFVIDQNGLDNFQNVSLEIMANISATATQID